MATQVQWRRGTHAQVLAFTGAVGEVAIDLTQWRLVVQDGVTPGGWPAARQVGDTLTPLVVNESAAALASAATTLLDSVLGNYIALSGTATITSFGAGSNVGECRTVECVSTPIFTNNANIILTGLIGSGTTYPAAAGDVLTFRYEGSSVWRLVSYALVSGRPPGASGLLFYLKGANLNSTADQPFTVNGSLPAKFRITDIVATNASGSPTTAVGGIYTAASKGGQAIIYAGQAYATLTAATALQQLAFGTGSAELSYSGTPILSLTTPQGSAMTADFYIFGAPLP